MIWLRDIRRIQFLLDFFEARIEIKIDSNNLPVAFLDWLHNKIMKSKFAEPENVIEGLKDARYTIIYYQDEGEFPFGKFIPDESADRDKFIIDKTLEYIKIDLTRKEREAREKHLNKKAAAFPQNDFQNKHIKNTGRGPAWYYPSSWEEKWQ